MADDVPVNEHLLNSTLSHLQRTCLDNIIAGFFFFFFYFLAALVSVLKEKERVFCIGTAWTTLMRKAGIIAFKKWFNFRSSCSSRQTQAAWMGTCCLEPCFYTALGIQGCSASLPSACRQATAKVSEQPAVFKWEEHLIPLCTWSKSCLCHGRLCSHF